MTLDRIPLTHRRPHRRSKSRTRWPRWARPGRLGIPRETILARLESFAADMSKMPGRFNILDIKGATVIIDYGHNAHALRAMIEALNTFPHQRRTAVYSTAGDRRDCDMLLMGQLLGDAFDRVILYEDHYVRGRAAGEIIELFRQGVAQGHAPGTSRRFKGRSSPWSTP